MMVNIIQIHRSVNKKGVPPASGLPDRLAELRPSAQAAGGSSYFRKAGTTSRALSEVYSEDNSRIAHIQEVERGTSA